jgi:acyl transferase domain-containing protein
VKTNLGHLEAASGIAGVIKTVLALTYERIPAHLHLERVSDDVDIATLGLAIPVETRDWPRGSRARFAGVSAFGFGGTNAHVVLRESPARSEPARAAARTSELLALSAKDPDALRALAAELSPRVTDLTWSRLCFTMNTGRDHFACRAAIVASDAASLRGGLARIAQGSSPAATISSRRAEPRVAFVFEELRALPGIARELFQAEPEFRAALERAAEIAGQALDAELLPALLDAVSARLEFPQTSALVVQHALHALLARWGVTPNIVFGSGTGEYAAACVAGALAWRDALQVVARRELLLSSLVPGARVRQTLAQFKARLASISHEVPALPLVLAGLDRRIAADETLGAKYWLDHLYARPEAARGLGTLRELQPELVVSFGPAQPGAERAEWLSCLGVAAMICSACSRLSRSSMNAARRSTLPRSTPGSNARSSDFRAIRFSASAAGWTSSPSPSRRARIRFCAPIRASTSVSRYVEVLGDGCGVLARRGRFRLGRHSIWRRGPRLVASQEDRE